MISAILAYARARMISLGFIEWEDAFNFDNIPNTLLDTSFHLSLGTLTRKNEHMDNVHIDAPFVVRLFSRSFVDTKQGRDAAISSADIVIDEFIKADNRLNSDDIKTIFFDSMNIGPLTKANDNSLIVQLDFTALVIKSTK